MPELFIELFSEEIPARMQARAADDLCRLLTEALAPLSPTEVRGFYGARRIAAVATVAAGVAESRSVERGPRRSAPEQALAGFLRKFNAPREDLREEGEFWVLERVVPGVQAAGLVASVMPGLLRRFPWPKSMRWGGTSGFTWVRPLRRITCVLDGTVVPFDLRDGADDGHSLVSGNQTEGHRFHAPGAFTVTSCAQWAEELMARQVVVQAGERKRMIAEGLAGLAATRGLAVLEDQGLLDEVAGLVEWPVPLIGAIDPAYMDLPDEVMQVSMRVNQRYFALRDALGRAAPFFAFVANIEAGDGGNAIIAGNERVLRARFADARHFWDLDRHATLASRVAALEGITFHAKLGTQGARVKRLVALAGKLAPLVGADVALAERAALLAKADLTTGMVGEFPELQGVMGGYYATHDNEPAAVAAAVRDHYLPKGPGDGLPENPVGVAVALADKLDQIVSFFAVGEKPTGSGDPFALRRAALGIIRILREGNIRLGLRDSAGWAAGDANAAAVPEVLDFLLDRLRVQLRADGARHDVLNAVLGAGADDDIVRLLARTAAVSEFLATEAGTNLLAASRRAANILRIETKKDGREFDGAIDSTLLEEPAERDLALAIGQVGPNVATAIGDERFTDAMASLAALRGPVDQFFDMILVNAERPELRQNRLRLLFHLRAAMNMAADFSRIEG
ncbi:MAG: glycine--tRNA ligase subunit beta [Alphaproteobacteria bacterium]|nr:glycine--tRNA ligase subunit beta [Alphaproteobacteria bacterium]